MIEALFNQPNYLAAKKNAGRGGAAPGCHRQQHRQPRNARLQARGPRAAFQQELERASSSGDPQQLAGLKPTLAVDTTAPAVSKDGNTVHLEKELMQMNQNAMTHSLETQLVSNMLARMRMAITGKS